MSKPLASWKDTPTRRAIVEFVQRVTREGGADYVPPAERIAVFDNDGTRSSPSTGIRRSTAATATSGSPP